MFGFLPLFLCFFCRVYNGKHTFYSKSWNCAFSLSSVGVGAVQLFSVTKTKQNNLCLCAHQHITLAYNHNVFSDRFISDLEDKFLNYLVTFQWLSVVTQATTNYYYCSHYGLLYWLFLAKLLARHFQSSRPRLKYLLATVVGCHSCHLQGEL